MSIKEMRSNEMRVLKSQLIKLDDTHAVIVTMQYHAEHGNRAASRYRWLARVVDVPEFKKYAESLFDTSVMLTEWKWPEDPTWDGVVATRDIDCKAAGEWMLMKIKKLRDWDLGMKLLDGWNNAKQEYNNAAKYDTEGYTCKDGSVISLKDRDALLKHVGENLWKEINMKSKTPPKTSAQEAK